MNLDYIFLPIEWLVLFGSSVVLVTLLAGIVRHWLDRKPLK
jgi:hypothetical protein